MTELPELMRSPQHLREAFIEGLADMLQAHQGLGVFILVLANATYDAEIYARLREPLRQRYRMLSERLRGELRAGRPVADAPDDVLVFLKLMAVGLDQLAPTQERRAGPFELQFNPLRAYRPARMSGASVSELHKAFDADGFHFNKPFLDKEILWSGSLCDLPCRLLYNKFPFAELHALLVIAPQQQRAQYLTQAHHQEIWQITQTLGEGLPGLGFGYNAYGAYASVNHQHFQMFVRSRGQYPLEEAHWQHNGGGQAYPLRCEVFTEMATAWQCLQALHERPEPYNLLYRPGRLYVLPRRFQGSYTHSPWTGGFAWSEVCGAVTTFNGDDFAALDEQTLEREMQRLRVAVG